MSIPAEATVHTAVRSKVFHESDACAPGPASRVTCSLREAVDAKRRPCENCVGDALFTAYCEVISE